MKKWFDIDEGDKSFNSRRKARTLSEAWEKTFTKWDLLRRGYGVGGDGHTGTCGLCNLYGSDGRYCKEAENYCDACPVKRVTKERNCHGTPYRAIPTTKDAEKEIKFLKKVKNETRKNIVRGSGKSICQKCGGEGGYEVRHPCPYDEDVFSDEWESWELCNCCDECMSDCGKEV